MFFCCIFESLLDHKQLMLSQVQFSTYFRMFTSFCQYEVYACSMHVVNPLLCSLCMQEHCWSYWNSWPWSPRTLGSQPCSWPYCDQVQIVAALWLYKCVCAVHVCACVHVHMCALWLLVNLPIPQKLHLVEPEGQSCTLPSTAYSCPLILSSGLVPL